MMSLLEEGNVFSGQNNPQHESSSSEDTEPKREDKISDAPENSVEWAWEDDPKNPYNWPTKLKVRQVVMMASAGFTTTVAVSILTPAHTQFMQEFGVSSTVAILPLSLYVFALGLGPVIGGPLSETVGRYPVYFGTTLFGTLFSLGAGFCQSFAGLCVLRFLAGFSFGPSLAIGGGTINETFKPAQRAVPSTIYILAPFLGPGLGPVIGCFVVDRKGWRWTQWTICFFGIFTMLTIMTCRETFHQVLRRRIAKAKGLSMPTPTPLSSQLRLFASTALLRPIQMLCTEPIVALVCLYVACNFATLFSFFAAIPYVFNEVYGFGLVDSGLLFISIVVGCPLGALTVMLCDVFLYRKRASKFLGRHVPPEYRLYPSMIGSICLPIGLFWFGWTSRASISWVSPVIAIMIFAWGNLCVFVSMIQYLVDTYHGQTVASAMSANSLARYGLAAAFPLFTIQMYSTLGIGWASSLLGFIAIALSPVPWLFYLKGERLRALSSFETATS